MKKINVLMAILLIGFSAVAQDFKTNTSKSELKWTGKKVTGEHWGYINIKEGSLTLMDDNTLKGVFYVDMTSLNVKDVESPEWNAKLVGHLKSDDFFSVEKFPVSTLTLTESTTLKNNSAEAKGELTIKGIKQPITFKVLKTERGFTAAITVDRTKYDIRYRSGKFFESLGDNMIYDDFTLDVNLVLE